MPEPITQTPQSREEFRQSDKPQTWESYREEAVARFFRIADEFPLWRPSADQIVWLNKYATDLELMDLGARGIDATGGDDA